ncbi:reverse transcriptase domain-containing protein [Deinococcus sp. UR1]|uniref:reverse transcriptase domain-containing protein n=1 Tax=Deinococcus sp. UR1 TaxID=1704277 RepID=UPI000AEAEB38|nr:reverse transcriptase domain-containing protein [Deinococcus sp. UR1]PIG98760.1 hypothetical protein AMD26_007410 [Deinococcus sp. UR1]
MKTTKELAQHLGIELKTLMFYAFALPDTKKYYHFEIKKRNGDSRRIDAPIITIKNIQSSLSLLLQNEYEKSAPKSVYGFRPGRGIIKNASAHLNKRVTIKVDLKDYFNSITGGMIVETLTSRPFGMDKQVARVIAGLCTIGGRLPQGAPTSPVLANIITRTLDIKLISFAHKTRGTYTRYADDLTFSYSHENTARQCAIYSEDGIVLNAEIIKHIESKGFTVNSNKLRYKKSTSRQMVTGIITNNKIPGLPREYIRETKLLIHILLKYGEKEAAEAYRRKYAQNRYGHRNNLDISAIVRGRLEYIKSVKGVKSSAYCKLALRYKAFNPQYKFEEEEQAVFNPEEIIILCEGKTDYKHLSAALAHFQRNGQFNSLKLDLTDKERGGYDGLQKQIDALLKVKLRQKHIAIFDADVPSISKKYYDPNDLYKVHENLFVIITPRPDHVESGENFCIEMLYKDKDLKRVSSEGRRIFLSNEFDAKTSKHKKEPYYVQDRIKDKLIVESPVYRFTDEGESLNYCRSKDDFAKEIEACHMTQPIDFSGFLPLFKKIYEVHSS